MVAWVEKIRGRQNQCRASECYRLNTNQFSRSKISSRGEQGDGKVRRERRTTYPPLFISSHRVGPGGVDAPGKAVTWYRLPSVSLLRGSLITGGKFCDKEA